MSGKILSVFIDESGDFGPYEQHSPYYIVSMVLHDQSVDISPNISVFNEHLMNLGHVGETVHTGPLIRREAEYKNDLVEDRKRLFNALFNFARRLDINYTCAKVIKTSKTDTISQTAALSRSFAEILNADTDFWNSFDNVIVYYDNGQIELTRILVSVFSTLYTHVEFRKVSPSDYKLFQVSDLLCTMELLAEKAKSGTFSASELEFFDNVRSFKKNYLKPIRKKMMCSALNVARASQNQSTK